MFTGIIAGTGTVRARTDRPGGSARLEIDAGDLVADLPDGGSLAVDGVCLTAVRAADPTNPGTARSGTPGTCTPGSETPDGVFRADVMGETLQRTALGDREPGARVNLERCLPATGRIDGHLVQGHVDGTGTVTAIEDLATWRRVLIEHHPRLAAFLAEKGSVAVDGASLTVTAVCPPGADPAWFEIALIPATLETTTLGEYTPGRTVNLETDVLAKYTQRLLAVAGAGQETP